MRPAKAQAPVRRVGRGRFLPRLVRTHALAAPRVNSLVRQHWTTARVASRALRENIKHKQGRLRVYLVLKENPQIRQHWTTARVASRAPKENIKHKQGRLHA